MRMIVLLTKKVRGNVPSGGNLRREETQTVRTGPMVVQLNSSR